MSEAPGPSWKAIMPVMQDEENQTEVLCYPHFVSKIEPGIVWRSQQCQTLISIGPNENNAKIYPMLINVDSKVIEREYIQCIPLSKKFHVRFSDLDVTPQDIPTRPPSVSILKNLKRTSPR